ncbi:S-adenosyl-L-methionine-dependent methyltransferase [Coniella lustricola]|uniref:S-adenosyl-L-methionine-dependent methyltransferase n=1 Tax=Coniella lustricola TaxID=2025994 RepID=A0A2T3A4V5_9PEZI|nr:S-adenosyl-L-methionine-dependent methyltransferase [Coniella lustricola]
MQDPDDEVDSAIDDGESATETLAASILEYRTIHGRTYHSNAIDGNAQYWGSNDPQQLAAMDINHHFLNLCTQNKLHFAPIDEDVQNVLDIGTGTGIWAIDFADTYPGAQVTGTDISPSQPQFVPPNVRFEIEDCTSPWTFTAGTYDYVHMRYLVGSIVDWLELYREAFKVLKPGGWLESFEGSPHMVSADGTIPARSAIAQWGRFFEEGGRRTGRSFLVVDYDVQWRAMEAAGFVDMQEWGFKAPVGTWPEDDDRKEVGEWAMHSLLSDIEGLVLFMANVIAGWSREEVTVYMAHLRRELRSAKYHAEFTMKAVWGRKPEDATD